VSTLPNPLTGSWPGITGNFPTPAPVDVGPTSGPGSTAPGGALNPFGQGTRGGGNLGFNLAGQNLLTADWRNKLIPLFQQMMMGSAGPAKDFFTQLTNLGSPFYQQKQRQSFEQGSKAGEDAAARARQAIQTSGAGYTPSGVGAAAIGGLGVGQAQNQAETFLNNLFQNEQLQGMGAQGLMQLAQLFSPAQLTGQPTPTSIQQPTNTGAEWLSAAAQLLPSGSYKVG